MGLRNRLSKLGVTALAGLAVAATTGGCAGGPAGSTAIPAYPGGAGALTVCAGENFYGDLLHQLGGSKVRVYAFLSNPNADPHQYESNSGNARAVADSRLAIENGLGYDAFMDKLLQASPNSKRIVINVQALVGAADGANPHLWYDPTVTPRVARAAAGALAQLDPANAPVYSANLGRLLSSLQPITDRVADLKSRFAGTPVAFTEPVYGYMAQAIGLSVRSPVTFMKAIEEGNDPPSQAVAAEQDLITQHRVKVLLYNSQTVTKITAGIRDLAVSSSIPVVGISETEPPGHTYQQWQLDELSRLEAALAG
jgi:zinc/manganese transport system substrate-binding protein